MDSALHLDGGLRWRRATILVTVVAAVELVLLLGLGFVLLGRGVSSHVEAAAKARAEAPAPVVRKRTPLRVAAPSLARTQTSVLVLNGNGLAGSASAGAARISALGYIVGGTGNAAHTLGRTTVMYRPGYRPEALRLARDLRVRVVGPLDGLRPQQLLGAELALVVGSDAPS